jgi:hypothetical protein
MKSVVLSVLASGAAAQITLGAIGGLGLGPELFQNAAINPSDPEYATCEDAVSLVRKCVSSVGGVDAAPTADADALVACACCDGSDNAAPIYSVCSKYLEEEAPENTSQYEGESHVLINIPFEVGILTTHFQPTALCTVYARLMVPNVLVEVVAAVVPALRAVLQQLQLMRRMIAPPSLPALLNRPMLQLA